MDDILNIMNKRFDVLEKRYEELEKNYELIKEENKKYKSAIQNNEQIIMILKKQIILVRKENQINLNNLKEYFIKLLPDLKQIENKENIKKGNNEIIINEEKKEMMDIGNIYKTMIEIIDKKIQEFELNFVKLLDNKKLNKKYLKKLEEINPQPHKIEKKKAIIDIKDRTIDELLIDKLIKIFSEQSPNIDINDINDLKKICSTLIIYKKEPEEKISEFIIKNLNNFQNELDENSKTYYAIKKTKIFESIEDISLLKNIETEDNEKYIKRFREKYGITEKDYSNKNLKKLIKKDYKEIDILKHILAELEYLKNK